MADVTFQKLLENPNTDWAELTASWVDDEIQSERDSLDQARASYVREATENMRSALSDSAVLPGEEIVLARVSLRDAEPMFHDLGVLPDVVPEVRALCESQGCELRGFHYRASERLGTYYLLTRKPVGSE